MVSPFVGNIKCIDKNYHVEATFEITSPLRKCQDQASHAKDSPILAPSKSPTNIQKHQIKKKVDFLKPNSLVKDCSMEDGPNTLLDESIGDYIATTSNKDKGCRLANHDE
jgi:hypothetical protein